MSDPTKPYTDAKSTSKPDGWNEIVCDPKGWNRINLPPSCTSLLVYVSHVDWNDGGGGQHTSPGPPGKHTGILFGPDHGTTIWLTATTPETRQAYWGFGPGQLFTTAVNDYGGDNSGEFRISVKFL